MKRKMLCLLVLVMVLLGCSRGGNGDESAAAVSDGDVVAAEPAAATAVAQVRPATGRLVVADGQLVAVTPLLTLSFESGGRLEAIHVQPGDRVEAGDLIATIEDGALQEAVDNARLQVAVAENNLAQVALPAQSTALNREATPAELDVAEAEMNVATAEADLDRLLNWSPEDETVAGQIAVAQANLAAARGQLSSAAGSDAAAQFGVETARISLDQARRELARVQEEYDNALDSARDWEPGIKEIREALAASLQFAQENVAVAEANFNSVEATATGGGAASAQGSVRSAQQALADLLAGPTAAEIESARQVVAQRTLALDRARSNLAGEGLRIEQVALALDQSELSLAQAEAALAQTQLVAPWAGIIATVETAPGALVAGGTPIVTLLDVSPMAFQTTNLSERDVGQIEPGQTAVITLKAYPNTPLEGTVTRIGWQAGALIGNEATFPVELALSDTNLEIRPGMTGRVEIQSGD